jgi:predicted dehydrogenase
MSFRAFPDPVVTPLRGGPTVRWGIVAPGEIAGDFTHALHTYTDQRVVAVGSRSAERAAAFAARHGISRSHGSYDALFADPAVDIVYVSSPNSEHAPLACAAIAAGKHVLVEKPMAASAAEAKTIADAARAAGVFAMEAMWSAFLPQTSIVRTLLADGVFGRIAVVTADFGADFSGIPDAIVFRPELAGGVLRDIGIYPLWFSSFVLGAPQTVDAFGSMTPAGVDEQAAVVLGFAGGAQAVLHTTMVADTPTFATINGTDARIEVARPFLMPSALSLYLAGDDEGVHWRDETGLAGRDGLAWQAVAVAQHIADGLTESPTHPLAETLSVLATLDEARRQLLTRALP